MQQSSTSKNEEDTLLDVTKHIADILLLLPKIQVQMIA
jgi:hypothetical protein